MTRPSSRARRQARQLKEAARFHLEHLQLNGDPDATEDDAVEALMGECGMMPDGSCGKAGSETCDECPFSG